MYVNFSAARFYALGVDEAYIASPTMSCLLFKRKLKTCKDQALSQFCIIFCCEIRIMTRRYIIIIIGIVIYTNMYSSFLKFDGLALAGKTFL